MPTDLEEWLIRDRDAVDALDGMDLIQQLQAERWGLVCVYVDRTRTDDAIEIIRTARSMTPGAILLLSDEELRSDDRALALDAGADDVLSHGIHLKELDARIRRALDSARPANATSRADTAAPAAVDSMLSEEDFEKFLGERLGSSEFAQFSLITAMLPDADEFGDILLSSVRADSGDLVGPMGDGFGVLLQDARAQQAEAFVRRVREELNRRGMSTDMETEILANPEHTDRIRTLIEA